KLAGQMKKIKASGFWNLSWLGGKTKYTESKWRGGCPGPRGQKRPQGVLLHHPNGTGAHRGAPLPPPGRKAGLFLSEARSRGDPHDPGDGGRAVPRGRGEVRGAHGAQGVVRPAALQDADGGRLRRVEVQEGLRQAPRRLRLDRLLPMVGGDETRPGPCAWGRG